MLLIRHPIESVEAVALLIGLWLIAIGVIRFATAFDEPDHRGRYALAGAIELIAGIVIVANPDIGLTTLSILVGMSVSDLSPKAVANLGWDKVRLAAPVFAGDTIYAESEVLAVRESKSRPTQGIVTVRTTGRKADGTVFMSYERSILVPKRGHAVDDSPGT